MSVLAVSSMFTTVSQSRRLTHQIADFHGMLDGVDCCLIPETPRTKPQTRHLATCTKVYCTLVRQTWHDTGIS